jgi:hypothetical protein
LFLVSRRKLVSKSKNYLPAFIAGLLKPRAINEIKNAR